MRCVTAPESRVLPDSSATEDDMVGIGEAIAGTPQRQLMHGGKPPVVVKPKVIPDPKPKVVVVKPKVIPDPKPKVVVVKKPEPIPDPKKVVVVKKPEPNPVPKKVVVVKKPEPIPVPKKKIEETTGRCEEALNRHIELSNLSGPSEDDATWIF